jgi:hypothetical protein
MFNFARKHWSHVLVALGVVGVLAAPLVFAQPALAARWTMKYLAIQNNTNEVIEVHLKYRTRVCPDCDFAWVPSPPGLPGDFRYTFYPHERSVILDESSHAILLSRFRFWGVSDRGRRWDYTNEDIWVVPPGEGIYTADRILTYTLIIE